MERTCANKTFGIFSCYQINAFLVDYLYSRSVNPWLKVFITSQKFDMIKQEDEGRESFDNKLSSGPELNTS